jgi:hypothetical protein
MQGSSGRCAGRTRGWIAVSAIAVLAALLVPDMVSLPRRLPRIRTSGNDYVAILDTQGRNQIVNFVIGAALHDGVGRVDEVAVPRDLDTLSARPGDKMIGGVQPAVQERLLVRLVGGTVVKADYDPRMSEAVIAGWASSGRLSSYPREVYLLRPKATSQAGAWVLLSDMTRLKVFLVPADEVPDAVALP